MSLTMLIETNYLIKKKSYDPLFFLDDSFQTFYKDKMDSQNTVNVILLV